MDEKRPPESYEKCFDLIGQMLTTLDKRITNLWIAVFTLAVGVVYLLFRGP